MAWVRIHDAAMTHPKVVGLSDKAFRLWVWGLSYAQQHLTNGLIVAIAVPTRLERAVADLLRVGLWERYEADFAIHDYLHWNDSRESVEAKRKGLKDRQARYQSKRVSNTSPRTVVDASSTSGVVISSSSTPEKKEMVEDAGDRAGRLLQELYPAWFLKHRGARLRLVANSLAYQDAVSVCETWDDARIEKLARIFLTTDEDWISRTDRSFRIFCSKATWCDDRLTQWEKSQRTA